MSRILSFSSFINESETPKISKVELIELVDELKLLMKKSIKLDVDASNINQDLPDETKENKKESFAQKKKDIGVKVKEILEKHPILKDFQKIIELDVQIESVEEREEVVVVANKEKGIGISGDDRKVKKEVSLKKNELIKKRKELDDSLEKQLKQLF